ncbi:MAG: diadenylate cyclase CdaA [Clostridia bacterium]|nr:diadenylate cyclase CdaA [Clostridia bacterium]
MNLLTMATPADGGLFRSLFAFLGRQFSSMSAFDIVRSVLDVLLLSLILYVAVRFLWDRRAGKLLMGLAIWLIALLLSRTLNFYAVGTILELISEAGILVLVLIFQPELRDALEKLGGEPLKNFKNFSGDTRNEATVEGINAICEAATDMARTKTGALIVIERSTKLGDIIRSGVDVDSKLTPYILKSVFFPNSPLHDGAVVIRNMRVCAAGCLLPLTRRQDVDPNLGTRHRAALGMSESCDAVIIVVSEETGTISLAYNRTLTRDFTSQTLKLRLSEILLSTHGSIAPKKEETEE